jgi:magnesium chelatase family protein
MLAKLRSFALVGIDALSEPAVRESVHRFERALANPGYQRHTSRPVIKLALAKLPKNAGGFDLPIALGLLGTTRQLLPEQLRNAANVLLE